MLPRRLDRVGAADTFAKSDIAAQKLGFPLMQLLAPDILEEARMLSPHLSGTGMFVGFLLWSLGGRTHRFWLAMSVTLSGGLAGTDPGQTVRHAAAGGRDCCWPSRRERWPCRWCAFCSSRPGAWLLWG